MKNYLKIVFDLLNREDLTQADILSALNFDERKQLFLSSEITSTLNDLMKRCNSAGIKVFTDEEFNILHNDGVDLLDRGILLPKPIAREQFLNRENRYSNPATNANLNNLTSAERESLADALIDKLNEKFFYPRFANVANLIMKVENDVIKEQLLMKLLGNKATRKQIDDGSLAPIIATFKSDQYKQRWVRRIRRDYRYQVIMTYSDEHKRVAHGLALDHNSQEEILLSLEDQEFVKKLALIPSFSKKVLLRIKDESVREKYFRRLSTMIKTEDKGEIVASFSTREKQLELLRLLRTEKARYELVTSSKVLTDSDRYEIARKFRSDERKSHVADYMSDEKIKNALLAKVNNQRIIRQAATYIGDINFFDQLISKLSDNELKKLYEQLTYSDTSYNLKLLLKVKDKKWVMARLEEIEVKDSIPMDLTRFVDMYAKSLKLNREHLAAFVQEFGYGTFKYIKSQRIIEAINQDEESFQKYMQLLKRSNFITDEKAVKNALFAFSQQEYRFTYPKAINAFSILLESMDARDYARATNVVKWAITETGYPLEKIYEFLDIKIENKNLQLNLNQLCNSLVNNMKQDKTERTLNFVHDIINLAVDSHRNRMSKEISEEHFKNVHHLVSDRALMDYFVYSAASDSSALNAAFFRCRAFLDPEEQEFMLNKERLNAVLDFKRHPDNSKMNEQLKKDLRLFSVIVRKMWQYGYDTNYMDFFIRSFPGVETKVNYDQSHDFEYIFSVLQQINPAKLKETIFNDPERYNALVKYLASNKLLGATKLVGKAAEAGKISLDESLLATLINNFPEVCANVAKREDKKNGLAEHLIEAEYFNSESYRYENLFGKEVFKYIRNNPGRNSATMPRKQRIALALEYVKKMYARKYIPVPGQNENHTLRSGKVLNAKLGDVTDLNNLVLGERTDACTRIGGAGREMFKLFTIDDRGFNIIFTDPYTGGFVSRASGFRNGNTIFLNELKMSEDYRYTVHDLIECVHQVAERIIEQTKDEPYPVENVVISDRCAMEYSGEEVVNLGVQSVKAGIGEFYTNIAADNAIVLATSAKGKKFAPVQLQLGYKKHLPLRVPPTYYEGPLALRQVNHMKTLKDFLGGKSLEAIDIKKENIVACYSTNSWVIYVNDKKEIKTLVVDGKKESIEEMHAMLEEIKGKLTNLEVTNGKNR